MLIALAALLFAPKTLTLTPTDDVWVYEHAGDPAHDPYLRVWGNGGKAVSDDPADISQYSYGYLRWDLSEIPTGSKLISAKLIVNQVAEPAYTTEEAKANPLEARAMSETFDEKSWSFALSSKVFPKRAPESVYGSGYPSLISKDGRVVPITIDLMSGKGDFAAAIQGAKSLCLGLTSKLDPSVGGMTSVYKVYSKDADRPENRPVLVLSFSN